MIDHQRRIEPTTTQRFDLPERLQDLPPDAQRLTEAQRRRVEAINSHPATAVWRWWLAFWGR